MPDGQAHWSFSPPDSGLRSPPVVDDLDLQRGALGQRVSEDQTRPIVFRGAPHRGEEGFEGSPPAAVLIEGFFRAAVGTRRFYGARAALCTRGSGSRTGATAQRRCTRLCSRRWRTWWSRCSLYRRSTRCCPQRRSDPAPRNSTAGRCRFRRRLAPCTTSRCSSQPCSCTRSLDPDIQAAARIHRSSK